MSYKLWCNFKRVSSSGVDYKQSLFFRLFSWSIKQNARDTQMTTRSATRRSRTRALPSLNLKKKSLLQAKKTWQSRSSFARTVLSSLLFFLLYRSSPYPLKPKLYSRLKLSGRFLGWRTWPIYALQTNHHAKFINFFKSWPLISTYFNVKSHNTSCNKKFYRFYCT